MNSSLLKKKKRVKRESGIMTYTEAIKCQKKKKTLLIFNLTLLSLHLGKWDFFF